MNWIRAMWMWMLSGAMLSVLTLVISATLPPGEGFIYPLRRLFFEVRAVAYLGTVVVLVVASVYAIPLMVSRGIAPIDPQTYRPIVPDMRAFAFLLVVSLITYLVVSRHDIMPRELASMQVIDTRYYLVIEEAPLFWDRIFLYECDSGGVVCRTIFTERGPRYNYDLHLMREGDTMIVLNGDETLFRAVQDEE